MEKLEGALLGLEALGVKTLESLLARGVLALADNATLLSLHQIFLGQATGSVLGSSVEHLRLGAHSDCGTSHHVAIVVILAILTSNVVHLLYLVRRKYLAHYPNIDNLGVFPASISPIKLSIFFAS